MTFLRQSIRICTAGLPLLLVALAVTASAALLASGSTNLVEARWLRGAAIACMSLTVVDALVLVGLLGWKATCDDEQGNDRAERSSANQE